MTTAVEPNGDKGGELDGDISPRNKDSSTLTQSIPSLDTSNNGLGSLTMRADPDAQATVTDFLDFTEYLSSDMMRSLTLIGNLDQAYLEASATVNGLTATWGKLPTLPVDQRPTPAKLRQEISENLNRAVSSRVFSHAEAVRIHENVVRHYNRAKTIHAKLQAMRDNFPTGEEQKSPTHVKSPQMVRTPKITLRLDSNGQKIQRPPRITVPGEVLAPYEIDFNSYTSLSDESSDDDEEEEEMPVSPPRQVATPSARIKVVKPPKSPKPPKQKIPKPPRPPRASTNRSDNTIPMMSTSTALAQLKPPPENAVPGSADAPWLQLTPYELAKLRKRMKKNAVWNPSDTMIARELKNLGRGVEAYRAAQKQAEEEGKPFEAALPAPVVDAESGAQHPPEGAISAEALTADEVQLSNRGMKLNEAKKLKRESMARIAAEEAEESARKMMEAARMFLSHEASPSVNGGQDRPPEASQSQGKATKQKTRKRKRNSMSETPVSEKPEVSQNLPANQPANQPEKPPMKRTKTETPVPLPQLTPRPPSVPPPPPASTAPAPTETPVPVPHLGKISQATTTSKTPVPVPLPVSSDTSMVTTRSAASSSATSPVPSSSITTTVPVKPPAETPVPLPLKTSNTPIPPPAREIPKRETRQNLQQVPTPAPANPKQPSSRGNTPTTTFTTEGQPTSTRRPTSRGKAASQEPLPTLAAERPRRASTARNTPAPELRQPSKRAKRPAPGVVTTNSGGTSAIGKRKAAPRKKAIGKKEKGANQEVEGEVDDDGNVIDPEEPRYCLCNGVSFGTMIQCDNVDNCKQEWFHLACVGLSEIPARTTKWYCPECRIALNIGGRGEVNSRGVRM
ncbi:uncharacterized protein GGS22DRAFT_34126 [Annulohypoxylon maeteangense]|uniref:uncharacterized protein n=1 Tax=Annulohypoxylon maeteangense TaxID=1927788 RepID=UPI0020084D0B|nr:uncharacterized protein GGS22DRAFT_34126 [Annulohypoxylon maeteangense]KAI0883650.1 hypothetical protein GGS22DRAFT_34126 [Annulohypoxylon maeteangense]